MENKIPLPTDNIYKFYALFGLLLFIFSAGSLIYVEQTANEFIFQEHAAYVAIQQIANPSAEDLAKKKDLETRLNLMLSDRKFFNVALEFFCAASIFLGSYGFRKWHKEIQPVQDEIAQLQLRKLRIEVGQLEKSSESKPPPATETAATGSK